MSRLVQISHAPFAPRFLPPSRTLRLSLSVSTRVLWDWRLVPKLNRSPRSNIAHSNAPIPKLIRHPNIVRLYDVIETDKFIGIMLEYASGGELFNYISHTDISVNATPALAIPPPNFISSALHFDKYTYSGEEYIKVCAGEDIQDHSFF